MKRGVAATVIDTNVLLVANRRHPTASCECVLSCVEHLLDARQNAVVVIDDAWRIIGEYQAKTHPNQPKGLGDAFLKWLLQNQRNRRHVHQVRITEAEPDRFAEFPDAELQEEFDPTDRKFAAVAYAHPAKPRVWQAVDSKWVDWAERLHAAGVRVKFLCPADIARFHQRKSPGRTKRHARSQPG